MRPSPVAPTGRRGFISGKGRDGTGGVGLRAGTVSSSPGWFIPWWRRWGRGAAGSGSGATGRGRSGRGGAGGGGHPGPPAGGAGPAPPRAKRPVRVSRPRGRCPRSLLPALGKGPGLFNNSLYFTPSEERPKRPPTSFSKVPTRSCPVCALHSGVFHLFLLRAGRSPSSPFHSHGISE